MLDFSAEIDAINLSERRPIGLRLCIDSFLSSGGNNERVKHKCLKVRCNKGDLDAFYHTSDEFLCRLPLSTLIPRK